MSWTFDDLVVLKNADVHIDTDIFAEVFEYENNNFRSIVLACDGCGAAPLAQHSLECKHATLLVLPDWYERLSS